MMKTTIMMPRKKRCLLSTLIIASFLFFGMTQILAENNVLGSSGVLPFSIQNNYTDKTLNLTKLQVTQVNSKVTTYWTPSPPQTLLGPGEGTIAKLSYTPSDASFIVYLTYSDSSNSSKSCAYVFIMTPNDPGFALESPASDQLACIMTEFNPYEDGIQIDIGVKN